MKHDYLTPIKISKSLVPYSDVLMCFFCDVKLKLSAIKNEAAKRAAYLISFQAYRVMLFCFPQLFLLT